MPAKPQHNGLSPKISPSGSQTDVTDKIATIRSNHTTRRLSDPFGNVFTHPRPLGDISIIQSLRDINFWQQLLRYLWRKLMEKPAVLR
jgi:hypothetical protein